MRLTAWRYSSSCLRSLTSTTPRLSTSSISRSVRTSTRIPQICQASPSALRQLSTVSSRRQEAAAARASNQDVGAGTAQVTRFEDLSERNLVHKNVVDTVVRRMGLHTMTDVQRMTINQALQGTDLIAQARTGTGKTLGFLIPVLQRMISADPKLSNTGYRRSRTSVDDIRAIIISPTRELAEQIATEAKRLTSGTSVIVQTAVGGTQKSQHLRMMQRDGCHILVGTPGRIKDIFSDGYSGVSAPGLQALVFDEADRLMDQGFWPEIREIMGLLPKPEEQDRQTLMFSATIPDEVVDLVQSTLKPGFEFVRTVQQDEVPTHERVPQKIVRVRSLENTIPALVELCTRAIKESEEDESKRPFKAIVYFNSTAEVTLAQSVLYKLRDPDAQSTGRPSGFDRNRNHPFGNIQIFDIHSKLSQAQRTRAADTFRRCRSGILVSSDVTARGMDFPDVTHVIQMGSPSMRDTYVHRIGRTGRAGKEGEGWLICPEIELSEARSRLRNLPIKPDDSFETAKVDMSAESDVSVSAGKIFDMVRNATARVSLPDKAGAYRALLGVMQYVGNKRALIASMNGLTKYGWGMDEPPVLSHSLASRLGIARIPGVNIGVEPDEQRSDRAGQFGGDGFGGARGGDRFGAPRGGDRFGGARDRRMNDDPFASRGGGFGNYGSARSGNRGGFGRSGGGGGGNRFGGGRGRDLPSDF